ncbi:MAG: CinA family protein [Halobacteriota archaeon]
MRFDDATMDAVARVHGALASRDEQLAIAESCTGGLVAGAMTAAAGASEVFELGVVTYSNVAKRRLLDVPQLTLSRTGAVSGPTARAMAVGVRNLGDATWGLSITGIAGPDGGRPGKPVGTVFIGVATSRDGRSKSRARRVRFDGDRASVRRQTVRSALERVGELVEASPRDR